MPVIDTILFDCDNTLVKSEELAFQACADLANEIFQKAGLAKTYTGPELQKAFVGRNFRGMLEGLSEKYDLKLDTDELNDYVGRELDAVIKKLQEEPVKPCDGVMDALARIAVATNSNGQKYTLSVVSSSAYTRVDAALKVTKMDQYFGDSIYSAATSLPTPTSKPNPAIYNFACEKLDKSVSQCVAIEDSWSGATAAARAGIPLIGYVGVYNDPKEREEAIEMLNGVGAIAILNHWDEFEECLAKVAAAPVPTPKI